MTVGHSVTLHGCYVERGSLIGIGSIVLDDVRVGAQSPVAAGFADYSRNKSHRCRPRVRTKERALMETSLMKNAIGALTLVLVCLPVSLHAQSPFTIIGELRDDSCQLIAGGNVCALQPVSRGLNVRDRVCAESDA